MTNSTEFRISDALLDGITDVQCRIERMSEEISNITRLAEEYEKYRLQFVEANRSVEKAKSTLNDERKKRMEAPDVVFALDMLDRQKEVVSKWADNKSELANIEHERSITLEKIETDLKTFHKALRTAEYEYNRLRELLRSPELSEQKAAWRKVSGN